tara:strand:+ start:8291 stop:8860 length:570 start_codon:yes stop_codon:yes gene_type:complete
MAHLNNSQLQTLITNSLADNETGEISALDLRAVTSALLENLGGWQVRTNSVVTPQTVIANTPTIVTNDHSVGTSENLPTYVTTPILVANRVSLAEFEADNFIQLKGRFKIITTTANTVFNFAFKAYNSENVLLRTQEFESNYFKTAGTYYIVSHLMDNISGFANYAQLEMTSDANVDILWEDTMVRVGL